MSASAAALLAIIVGVVGVFVGWQARTVRGAHSDVKMYKGRIPGLRRVRNRNVLWALALVVITLFALSTLFRGS